ncbi:hypothetical protein ACN4EK_17710 [Pantanalinema rosaneae CENA516]|uniref:hypothetical protein n=1 Tax=Pantanalinema rosaneae TaxID=1620701 RepID=UPI003D6EDE62
MKRISITSVATLLTLAVSSVAVQAQPSGFVSDGQTNSCVNQARASENPTVNILAVGRAKNLARQAAESANGGLGNYHAENAMHGPIGGVNCTANDNGTMTFTFQGGRPGFTTPTVQTTVTVDPANWTVTVDSNGPIGS